VSKEQEEKPKKEDKHKIDLKAILTPYYIEERLDKTTGKMVKRSITPEKLLDSFDPLPSRALQEKLDFFFLPYN